MKLSVAALFMALASSNAFVTPNTGTRSSVGTFTRSHRGVLCMASAAEDEVEKLRAAAEKAREDAAKLAKELGYEEEESGGTAKATKVEAKQSMSVEDLSSLTSSIDFEGGDAVSQTMKLDSMVSSGDLALWKSASSSLRTFPVSLNFLESRTGGKVTAASLGVDGEGDVSMDDFKYATLGVTLGASVLGIGALAVLPENIGATVCYLLALVPVGFLAVGSTAPGIIAGAIAGAKGTADSEEQRLDRICRHEAGHFMCGYLCGLPIKGYSLLDSGVPCVEFHPSSEGNVSRELSRDEIAALSAVAMSGSVAEVLALGDARGGDNDLIELNALFRRSEEFLGAQKQQDLTRWGALTAYNLLNSNQEKYEALVQAFKEQKSVSECVAILESR